MVVCLCLNADTVFFFNSRIHNMNVSKVSCEHILNVTMVYHSIDCVL